MMIQTGGARNAQRVMLYIALGMGVLIAVWLVSYVPNADWYGTFDPAGRSVLRGHSPYEQPLFVNPPWAVFIILPFVLLPPALARGLVLVFSLGALIYTAWRMHAPKIAVIALLLSPTAIGSLLAANLDAFVVLGVFLPPMWGLFVLMIKPQIGFGVACYLLVESWRTHRVASILRTFGPVLVAFLVCGILFPVWVSRMIHKPENVWNRGLFPFGIPFGLFFLWQAIRRHNPFLALAAAPFFAPYLTFYTYLVVQIGLLHEDVEKVIRRDVLQIMLCIFLWIVMLVFRL